MYLFETKNLVKKFGEVIAVNNLNLKIKEGIVTGLLGPNGAGKTTTLRMLVGQIAPTHGEIFFCGKGLNFNIYKKFGFCPQDSVFWPRLTCEENLFLIGKMYDIPFEILKKRVEELLKQLMLYNKKKEIAFKLSFGMQKRLSFAMAMVHEPDIIFLDEPTTGLDPAARLNFWEYIKRLVLSKKSIVLSTNSMEEAEKLCDEVAIIDKGNLLALGTPANLKKKFSQKDVVEIQLSNSEGIERVIKELEKVEGVQKIFELETRIILQIENAVKKISELVDVIEKISGVELTCISLKQVTLEDVFFHLTGSELVR